MGNPDDHVIDYAKGQMTVVTNSLGHKTAYKLNPIGQVVEVIDARGGTTKYEYDERSLKKTKETDPLGNETKTEYDARGNVTKIVRADGSEVSVEYSSQNRPVRTVDPIGGEWRWAYDSAGRVNASQNPANERTQFHWGEAGLNAFTDAAGQHTQLAYDANGNLNSLVEPGGNANSWSYDRLGRSTASTDVNGNQRHYVRDALGRSLAAHDPDGNVLSLTYDGEGNVTHAVDQQYDVKFEYCGMNRLAARTQAGTRLEFQYNTEEDLCGIKNEHGLVYRFVVDPAGDVHEEYGFDDLRRTYIRDAAGRIAQAVRPEGRKTTYTYDKLGRVLAVAHSDDTREDFTYRADGEMIAAKNGAMEVIFERDPLGRLIRETQGDDWVASVYGPLGLRHEVRSSKGLYQRIQRNAMGDVLGLDATMSGARRAEALPSGMGSSSSAPVGSSASFSAAFQRDRLGLEIDRALPGGVRAHWDRDRIGRPLRHEVYSGGQAVSGKHYTWDTNDRLRRVVDAMRGPVEHSHDALGNLAATSHADGRVDLRMPDAVGNLFRTQDRSDRVYGRAGELLEARDARGVTRYEYDPEGNLKRKLEPDGGEWHYVWNGSGRLTRVERPDGKTVEFEYDALGRRISKSYRGKKTRWIWDGHVPLHEWVERDPSHVPSDEAEQPAQTAKTSSIEAEFREIWLTQQPAQGPPAEEVDETQLGTPDAPITWLFEPESFAPLGKLVAGVHYGIVTDHLGTPTAMFDGAGKEVWGADIDTYGDLRNQRGPRQACPFRWPGQYEDAETGLYYNRFRYYDREAGEYVSPDPIGLNGGFHAYGYVHDPNAWGDPLGLKKCNISQDAKDKLNNELSHIRDALNNPHMHHIVMEGAFSRWNARTRAMIQRSRNILAAHGIDLQGIDNVVWAENAGHSKEYAERVYNALKEASPQGRQAVVDALKKIGESLQ